MIHWHFGSVEFVQMSLVLAVTTLAKAEVVAEHTVETEGTGGDRLLATVTGEP